MINKKNVLVMLILASVILVSGCAQQPAGENKTVTDIKSDKDVGAVVDDVSTDISDFTKELDNIDKGLG